MTDASMEHAYVSSQIHSRSCSTSIHTDRLTLKQHSRYGTCQDTDRSPEHATTQSPSTQTHGQGTANVEQLRHLVASLRVGTDFAKAITHALRMLGNLLGSATLSDVQETLGLVITCRQFQVTGVDRLQRQMLPLVFAREQGKQPLFL